MSSHIDVLYQTLQGWIVLRYKPSDMSYECKPNFLTQKLCLLTGVLSAYVLDLHAQFPLESDAIPTVEHWRKRSLRLEKELSELLDTYQVEHTGAILSNWCISDDPIF